MNVSCDTNLWTNLVITYRCRIEDIAGKEFDVPVNLEVYISHWHATVGYRPWAGFSAALENTQADAMQDALRPTLLFGLYSRCKLPSFPQKQLLQWSGAQYLRYDVDDVALKEAVQDCIDGCRNPLPESLQLSTTEMLRVISEVSHWLQGRLRNSEAGLADFKRAATGEQDLHPAHLRPVPALSSQHRAMLARLWRLDPWLRLNCATPDEMCACRNAISAFEDAWRSLETTRAALCRKVTTEELDDAIEGYRLVRNQLEGAVKALSSLRSRLEGSASLEADRAGLAQDVDSSVACP